jgi:hypothetical protein
MLKRQLEQDVFVDFVSTLSLLTEALKTPASLE